MGRRPPNGVFEAVCQQLNAGGYEIVQQLRATQRDSTSWCARTGSELFRNSRVGASSARMLPPAAKSSRSSPLDRRAVASNLDRRLRGERSEIAGGDEIALVFVQFDRLFENSRRLLRSACEAQDLGEIGKRVCSEDRKVGPFG